MVVDDVVVDDDGADDFGVLGPVGVVGVAVGMGPTVKERARDCQAAGRSPLADVATVWVSPEWPRAAKRVAVLPLRL